MYKIYKYMFALDDTFHIDFPGIDPKIFKIGKQEGSPKGIYCIWALVDATSKEKTRKEFKVYGTGHDVLFPTKLKHIDSLIDGFYVWHFFEVL